MHVTHFANLDLNLLRVFDALLQEESVSRAGTRLGLSQSAVSHALGRLRQALGDELFRRGPLGMQPTARALEIGPAVHAALLQVQAALAPQRFDPEADERRFTLIAGPYVSAVLIPELAARLRARAPKVQLRVTSFAWDAIESLEIGRADAAVSAFEGAAERFVFQRLFTETMVWVVRSGHPMAALGGKLTLEALATAEHVAMDYPRPEIAPPEERRLRRRTALEDRGAFDRELGLMGLTRRVGVVAPDSYTALAIVSRTDMTALVPRRLAERAAQRGVLQLLEPPYDSPPLEIGVLHMRDRAGDPAQVWLLEQLAESSQGL
jgi:DNA-binding transcriptional LysR family regulator